MKRIVLSLALVLLIGLSACSAQTEQPTTTDTPAPTPTSTITPTPTPELTPEPTLTPLPAAAPVWSEQTFAGTYQAEDGTVVLDVTYRLPFVTNTHACPAGEAINQWYKAESASRQAEAEAEYEMALSDYAISVELDMPFQAAVHDMSYEITRQDDAVISVARTLYVNYGGAHPYVARLSEQFDAVTGAKMGFAQFFTDADAVCDIAIDALTAEHGLDRATIAAAFQPESFYFTEEACVFWIQGGQIPGAGASPLEAAVPYTALTDWMRHG